MYFFLLLKEFKDALDAVYQTYFKTEFKFLKSKFKSGKPRLFVILQQIWWVQRLIVNWSKSELLSIRNVYHTVVKWKVKDIKPNKQAPRIEYVQVWRILLTILHSVLPFLWHSSVKQDSFLMHNSSKPLLCLTFDT